MEMKHKSAIKQLMREFNTQMALKEKELDSAVKETIGEAEETIVTLSHTEITQSCFRRKNKTPESTSTSARLPPPAPFE